MDGEEVGAAGIYSNFPGYRTPTDAEYVEALLSGLVVLDANILLGLYRLRSSARDDLLGVLSALGDRLWIPHQVLEEFWRNRGQVLRDPRDVAQTLDKLDGLGSQASQLLKQWGKRVALDQLDQTGILQLIDQAFADVAAMVAMHNDEGAPAAARNTGQDVVLERLEPILEGRVGARPSEEVMAERHVEGARRIAQKIPPGYKDVGKPEGRETGDYLVWAEILEHARGRGQPVLLVSADDKEDWLRIEHGERRGPRVELVSEMSQAAGCQLLMMTPAKFLEFGARHLDVSIDSASADSLEAATKSPDVAEQGAVQWDAPSVVRVMEQLAVQAPSQHAVILAAASNGGSVSREQVYEICGYKPERTLRGFTRPVRRVAHEMAMSGQIPRGLVPLLVTDYDGEVVARGFSVAGSAIALLIAIAQDDMDEAVSD